MRRSDPRGRGPASRGSGAGKGGPSRPGGRAAPGPSQRQLRAGELVRHALAEILREADLQDPALAGVSVTVTEVRMSPDLRHATGFVRPLGGERSDEVVAGLNRVSRFLRGRLGHQIALKFTPDLHFRHDDSFDAAAHMDALFDSPQVKRDLRGGDGGEDDGGPGND
jgi:ribosome-binding factor A